MNKTKIFIGILGTIGTTTIATITTLSCSKNKQPINFVDTEIKLKTNDFTAISLGFDKSQIVNDAINNINEKWILEKLTIMFDNLDVDKVSESDIVLVNKKEISGTDISVSFKLQNKTFDFCIRGFATREITIRNDKIFKAIELFGENNLKTAEEANNQINAKWIKDRSNIIFHNITNDDLDKIQDSNIKTKIIGNTIFVMLRIENLLSDEFEIIEFKTSEPVEQEIKINPNIELNSNQFDDLKDKTSNQATNIINNQWLLKNQQKIFGTTLLKIEDITINNKGPETNTFRLYATVAKTSVLIRIKNFISTVERQKTRFTASDLGFSIIKPSLALASVNKEFIFNNSNKLFYIYGDLRLNDIKYVNASILDNNIVVKTFIFNKQLEFTIIGFKDKYIDPKKSQFNINELSIKTSNEQSKVLDYLYDEKNARNFILGNKDNLFDHYGLKVNDTTITSIVPRISENGSIQITISFSNYVEKLFFKIVGLKMDISYIKHIQATATRAGRGKYKFKFVIVGNNLPTSNFRNNFKIKKISSKTNNTLSYSEHTTIYWSHTNSTQTSERIEVEITREGQWYCGERMLIYMANRSSRYLEEGFQLRLPWPN